MGAVSIVTVMYVNAFVSAGTKSSGCSVIFCRYTNRETLELRSIRKSTSYYKERRMYAMPPALTRGVATGYARNATAYPVSWSS
jgi:hypothetical protein